MDGRKITLAFAQEILSDLVGDSEPLAVTLEKIFAATAKKYSVTKEEIVGKKRTKEIMQARHVAVYLIREITEISFPTIGKMFGKDHSTTHSSYEWVKKKIIQSPLFDADIEALKKEIYGL